MHPLPPPPPRQKTLFYLESLKKQNTPIVALTAFDYPSSLAVRSADVDLCLVGDSLANVALGYPTTRHVSLQEMIFACQAVQRGLGSPILAASARFASPLVVCDLPFGTFEVSVEEGTRAALRIIQEGKVDAIKIEGGEEIYPLVRTLTKFGIPVMGHVGLQPQKVSSTSGYRVQGRLARDAFTIYKQALELQAAGVFSLVLECVPSKLARYITENLDIPTIGIGAGSGTDGQVLVQSDMVGELTSPAHVLAGLAEAGSSESKQDPPLASNGKQVPVPHPNAPRPPKFVRTFTPGNSTIGALRQAAVQAYTEAVRRRDFPSEGAASNDQAAAAARAEEGPAPTGESYRMKKEEWAGFLELVAKDR
ncbi:ketopantoate hydroxymethyltransferase [Tilletiaria anomala UBC 951]|uniref:3-methyl-2-oxobutanoate hydroxymethyltransferase n=1 Tax=Tilletiaria anomala (strain ATCC 24038 / CBS 436.72 / UBC 951) TaxID=1037660 RepID=A0A066WBP0_TILAU|nr:ketopantoate hydroxymethyltransferase [Tilletiaria anomala UBC 951]KDN49953.1 ketopantoate hydroxymethyltransferase [Tilletiaria anomala UBC 951]